MEELVRGSTVTWEGALTPHEVTDINHALVSLIPHEASDRGGNLDAAANGAGDVDVTSACERYPEERDGQGVREELYVGPRDVGRPHVGPLPPLDEDGVQLGHGRG